MVNSGVHFLLDLFAILDLLQLLVATPLLVWRESITETEYTAIDVLSNKKHNCGWGYIELNVLRGMQHVLSGCTFGEAWISVDLQMCYQYIYQHEADVG